MAVAQASLATPQVEVVGFDSVVISPLDAAPQGQLPNTETVPIETIFQEIEHGGNPKHPAYPVF
jgi:hypothetical protein